jgi:hypothetical protein
MPKRRHPRASHGHAKKHHGAVPRHGSPRRRRGRRLIWVAFFVLLALTFVRLYLKDWVFAWKARHSHSDNFVRVP